jgi:hypothetical protein
MVVIKRITNITLILLLLTPILSAQDAPFGDGVQPRFVIQSSPEYPVAGSTWVLTLLIAHDEPREVEVLAPPFTGSLFMEQVIKRLRIVNETESWTAMEYRFTMNSPGTISFNAFTIITPQGQVTTEPFDVRVGRPQGVVEPRVYRLIWEGIPSGLSVGGSAVLSLRVSGWNSAAGSETALPAAALFMPPVPPGHILESLPLTQGERSAGIALKLRLIPLEAVPFALERRQLSTAATVFEIPALRISVSSTPKPETIPATVDTSSDEGSSIPPFPSLELVAAAHLDLFRRHQAVCQVTYDLANGFWQRGCFADALAELRQKERDHPAGSLIAGIRRRAEQSLGLTGTGDEQRGILRLLRGKTRSAVLMETALRRIPEQVGEEIVRLREGQPVLVLSQGAGTWLQVITYDDNKASGWVPEEKIKFY